jgi:hypothetical protein
LQSTNSICSPTSFEGIEFTTARLSCRQVLRDSNEYTTFTLKAYQGGTCCSSFTFGMAMQSTLERRHLPFQTGDRKYYVPSTDDEALSAYEASAAS